MTDTVNATSRPSTTTLASPKINKPKPNPAPGAIASVAFGCEHTQAFYKSGEKPWKTLSNQYNLILKALRDEPNSKSQTVRLAKEKTAPTLRPTYLCLQCPNIFPEEGISAHFDGVKAHSFFVESRSGHIFCHNCSDFIYDPALEALRLRSQNPSSRKRKFDDFAAIDAPLITTNSAFVPCRAIGLRGLYNMGNTCFMSVVIQSLLHNPFIKAWYLSEGHKSTECERDTCTSCALDEIFCEFWSVEKTEGYGAVPMLLSSWKSAEHLAGYQQQDAHEYMQFILNSLHSTNSGPSGEEDHDRDCDCIIHKTFYGKLQSTVTCDDCKNKTNAVDPFMDLSLDLRIQTKKRKLNGTSKANGDSKDDSKKDGDSGMRLEECLTRFTSEEKLAREEYTCQKCAKQRDAAKQLSIKRLPPVLSIHLKRFSHTKDKSSKLETPVSFPLTLDMAPYTTSHQNTTRKAQHSAFEAAPSSAAKYSLSAVIVHKGEINSGHYVSYAREGKDWFLFDDSKVVLAAESDVLSAQAYLLVYVIGTV